MNGEGKQPVVYAEEAFRIQGAVFEVNRRMGSGFLEAVYQECLAFEFAERQIPFVATPTLTLSYRGNVLRAIYQPDFICFDRIIVELKAISELAPPHKAQLKNYLKASGLHLGMLVNFGVPKADVLRIVL